MKKLISAALLTALILTLSVAGLAMGGKPQVQPGIMALDFSQKTLDGNREMLSLHRGKIVFLNFWASWCPACRSELPSIQRLNQKMVGKSFVLLTVAVDQGGELALRPFMKQNNLLFPVIIDSDGYLSNQYGVVNIPTTFIIDKNGRIIDKVIGSREWDDPAVIEKFNKLVK